LAGPDLTLNAPIGDSGDDEWLDRTADDRPSPEDIVSAAQESNWRQACLDRALDRLTPREKGVVAARRLGEEPATLQIHSDRFGVSRERVRQIELRAIEKMRRTAAAMTRGALGG
jgi:RNA polymerase sigma-32 factor